MKKGPRQRRTHITHIDLDFISIIESHFCSAVQPVILVRVVWKVDFTKRTRRKCHLGFKISIWTAQRVLTPIVLLVISLDRMQM